MPFSFGRMASAAQKQGGDSMKANSLPAKLWSIRLLLVALALGQIIDVLATNNSLAGGGKKELNPVMRVVMNLYGEHWWLWKAFIAVFLIYLAITIRSPSWRKIGLAGVVAVLQLLVIISNLMYW